VRCVSQFFIEEINTRLRLGSKTVRIVQRVIVGLSSRADQTGAEILAVVAAPPADNVGCSPEIPAVGVEEKSSEDRLNAMISPAGSLCSLSFRIFAWSACYSLASALAASVGAQNAVSSMINPP
jgi:hypothetical protein